MKDKTMLFQIESKNSKEVQKVLKEVYLSLKERGYNPTDQIVGYLISGDLGYISSYQDARRKMQSLDRSKVVEVLLDSFLRG
ncbi:MAG: IreB family regulatory phosphoprotein [Clostridium sp.]|nr:IreB family regulatory phosphoprotein [Clostridium sp.]